jgi:RNA polymerase sigma-70 factor (ECF subfamily)
MGDGAIQATGMFLMRPWIGSHKQTMARMSAHLEGDLPQRQERLETVDLEAPAAAGVHNTRLDARPEARAESAETGEQVRAALGKLPFDYKEAVVLRDLAGLSNEEVADVLGLSVAAAKSRIHRGRMQLRELLEPDATS